MTGEFAKCNKCGKLALGEEEIADVFGFRNLHGVRKPQTWCKECRREGLKAYHEKKKAKENANGFDWDDFEESEESFVLHLTFAEYHILKNILNKLLGGDSDGKN